MADIIINSKYAPGISTYGIPGQEGKKGNAGYGLYFLPYELTDGVNKDYIKSCIKNNNYVINNNYTDITNKHLSDRVYQTHDLFLTPSGKIHKLTINGNNKEATIDDINDIKISFNELGSLLNDTSIFKYTDDYEYIVNTTNKVIFTNGTEIGNINNASLVNFYNVENILSCINTNNTNNINYLDIKYDTGGYYINTNTTLNIDNMLVKYDNNISDNNGYYKIITNETTKLENDIIINGNLIKISNSKDYNICVQYFISDETDTVDDETSTSNYLVPRYKFINSKVTEISIENNMLNPKLIISNKINYISKYINLLDFKINSVTIEQESNG